MVVFRTDPCGITCMIITYLAIGYADYVVVRHLILSVPALSDTLWGSLNVLLFNTVIFLLMLSHLRAVLSDPGIVPFSKTSLDFSDLHSGKQKVDKPNNGFTVCMKCEIYRPERAHHCRICQRCIRRMDHHCPWINNCVGEFNQKYFIQFLFYVGVASLYSISLVIISWILSDHSELMSDTRQFKIIHSVVLIVESCLFGLFVIAIGCDQMQSIFSDETGIEQLKKQGPYRASKSKRTLLSEVFGKGPTICWLLPCQSNGPSSELLLQEDYSV